MATPAATLSATTAAVPLWAPRKSAIRTPLATSSASIMAASKAVLAMPWPFTPASVGATPATQATPAREQGR